MRFFKIATIIALIVAFSLSIFTSIDLPTAFKRYNSLIIQRQTEQTRAEGVAAFIARAAEMDKVKKMLWPHTTFDDPPEKTIKAMFSCSEDRYLDVFPCIPTATQVFENQNLGSRYQVPETTEDLMFEDHDSVSSDIVLPAVTSSDTVPHSFPSLLTFITSFRSFDALRSSIALVIERYSSAHSAATTSSASFLPREVKGQFAQQLESGVLLSGQKEVAATKTAAPLPVASFPIPSRLITPKPTAPLSPNSPPTPTPTLVSVDSGSAADIIDIPSPDLQVRVIAREDWHLFISYMAMGIYIICRGP